MRGQCSPPRATGRKPRKNLAATEGWQNPDRPRIKISPARRPRADRRRPRGKVYPVMVFRNLGIFPAASRAWGAEPAPVAPASPHRGRGSWVRPRADALRPPGRAGGSAIGYLESAFFAMGLSTTRLKPMSTSTGLSTRPIDRGPGIASPAAR
jgi:hypothetical protein